MFYVFSCAAQEAGLVTDSHGFDGLFELLKG